MGMLPIKKAALPDYFIVDYVRVYDPVAPAEKAPPAPEKK